MSKFWTQCCPGQHKPSNLQAPTMNIYNVINKSFVVKYYFEFSRNETKEIRLKEKLISVIYIVPKRVKETSNTGFSIGQQFPHKRGGCIDNIESSCI